MDKELLGRCWTRVEEEATSCQISQYELELKRSGEDAASCKMFMEPQIPLLQNGVQGAVSFAQKKIGQKVKELEGNPDLRKSFSLLEFWKELSSMQFISPIVAAVKAVLSIPASAAAPERLFSLTGRIVTKDRNQFAPETVASISKAHSFIRNPPSEYRSWSGAKREREQDPKYAVISAKKMKELVSSVDPASEQEKLVEKLERQEHRRRMMQEEWDD